MKYLFALLLVIPLLANAVMPLMNDGVPFSAIRTRDVTDICTTKTSTIRNVPEVVKKEVYRRAGVTYGDRTLCSKGYEVDHIISLQLGGTNDMSNLQLQAYCTKVELSPTFPNTVKYDARAKDAKETSLHADICHGRITPKAAQEQMFNWHN